MPDYKNLELKRELIKDAAMNKLLSNALVVNLVVMGLVTNLLMNPSFARCDDQAVYLPKGQVAPYSGFEVPQSTVVNLHNLAVQLDAQQKINANLTQENALYQQRVENAQQESTYLSDELVKTRDNGIFAKVGCFVLGAAVTGLISYGIYKAK